MIRLFVVTPFVGSDGEAIVCFVINRRAGLQIILSYRSQTFVPSLQLEQMSIFLRPFSILFLKVRYSPFFQISLKDFFFRSPSWCWASLSKQQGATSPSQVITGSCQSRQQ